MEAFWGHICTGLDIPDAVAKAWWQKILSGYSEDHRFYHNVEEMFVTHKLPHLLNDKGNSPVLDPAIALASVFQYLVYKPMTDLSEDNCQMFLEFCSESGLNENQPLLVKHVQRILKGTTETEDPQEVFNFFQDLDLAVLGADASKYNDYRTKLRQEFTELDDESYNKMRLKVLQSLLMVPSIYTSEAFVQLEFNARANIEKEIAELSGK